MIDYITHNEMNYPNESKQVVLNLKYLINSKSDFLDKCERVNTCS
jgi:hypothetical protein